MIQCQQNSYKQEDAGPGLLITWKKMFSDQKNIDRYDVDFCSENVFFIVKNRKAEL